jgi:hypothetical protein
MQSVCEIPTKVHGNPARQAAIKVSNTLIHRQKNHDDLFSYYSPINPCADHASPLSLGSTFPLEPKQPLLLFLLLFTPVIG